MKTLVILAAVFTAAPAFARYLSASAVISGFRLNQCAETQCIKIESPRAMQGNLGLITLDEVKVQVVRGKSVKTVVGQDAVYDPLSQTLAIRKVTRGPAREIIVHLESGRLEFF